MSVDGGAAPCGSDTKRTSDPTCTASAGCSLYAPTAYIFVPPAPTATVNAIFPADTYASNNITPRFPPPKFFIQA